MNKLSKKNDRLVNAILFVILILTIGIILFLTKSNVFHKNDNKEEEVVKIPNSGYEVYEVEDLNNKIGKLSFTNKKQDFYNKSSKYTINTIITSGHVKITIKIDSTKVEYEVENVENATSVATNVYKNTHVTYILTKDGIVYKVQDDLDKIKDIKDYKGSANPLGLTNIVKMAIDKNLKFKVNSELKDVVPCVYVNRVFTDESIIEGKSIVELVEKEVKNENASTN